MFKTNSAIQFKRNQNEYECEQRRKQQQQGRVATETAHTNPARSERIGVESKPSDESDRNRLAQRLTTSLAIDVSI